MFDNNPSLIQDGPPPSSSVSLWSAAAAQHKPTTPLVLIHDGGGTIFSYYCLGTFSPPRRVYGIANPRYHSDETPHFPGGIPQMAEEYLRLIKQEVLLPTGGDGGGGSSKVILGGWSLGGLISLQVARLIADEAYNCTHDGDDADNGWRRRLEVVGIVMVDSVCPLAVAAAAAAEDEGGGGGWGPNEQKAFIEATARKNMKKVVPHVTQWGESTRQETKEKVTRCFDEAVRMVGEWKLPEWEGARLPAPPPPVILLRAREQVPVLEKGGVSRVDVYRADRFLGWTGYRKDLIKKVVDIPGHHFNIFSTQENLDAATDEIQRACVELEAMQSEKDFGRKRW